MPKFKLIVSDPKNGKSSSIELDDQKSKSLIGRQIDEVIDGSALGLKGKVKITGGSDKDGIPMRKDILGGSKKFIILSGGVGFNPKRKGERKRKVVRGKMITEDTYQINVILREEKEAKGKQ
ncbi:MAG: 30S ribosomal protein S6e [Candidatus Bathyarchaeota archaeon]|nr:30S ribosomal protein S6e [Candidatus Bathyarchaeota archaeon]MCZ2845971.1 30S ribosomal protein S6e [Candidatus Bathyarchaeota archaeon]